MVCRMRRAGHDGTPRPSGGSRLRRAGVFISALIAAVICSAVLANFVVMPIIAGQGDLVPTPDLVGRSVIEAQRLARESGLSVHVGAERCDASVPVGHIARQIPGAGVDMKLGRTVRVIVSSGTDVAEVPRLSGLPMRQAQLEAERSGLSVSHVVEAYSDRVGKGRVVGTCPGAGAKLPTGAELRMLVSLGRRPRELLMPSLIGKTPEEAKVVADELGLIVKSVKYERGRESGVLRDVVVVQDPVAGSRVTEGEGVTLRVGKG